MISNQDKKNELKWFKLWKQWRNGIFVKYYDQVFVLSFFFGYFGYKLEPNGYFG